MIEATKEGQPFGYFHELLDHEGKGTGVWLGCSQKHVVEQSYIEGEVGTEIVALYDAPQASQPIGQPEQEKCGGREYCGRIPFCGCGQPPLFPERDLAKPAEQQGIFRKFEVRRVDGSDAPGGRHHGCRYFVIDMDHDLHAPAALHAYADSCAATHPQLAADLRAEFGASNSQQASGAGMTDERTTHDSWFYREYPAAHGISKGLYTMSLEGWKARALLSASGQAGQSEAKAEKGNSNGM